jgi:hypothetical protein
LKLIYTNENSFLVHHAKNILENIGIKTILKNQYLSGVMGELPPIETWLQLWLVHESDIKIAQTELKFLETNDANKVEWSCKSCNETNDGNFEICWKCQTINKLSLKC